jgi:hypothetical protein
LTNIKTFFANLPILTIFTSKFTKLIPNLILISICFVAILHQETNGLFQQQIKFYKMKKLELNQMENLEGGNDCQDRVLGAAAGIITGSAFGGPVSLMVGLTFGTILALGSVACGRN